MSIDLILYYFTKEFNENSTTLVEPMMVKKDRKTTIQALHTDAVNKAVKSHKRNVVLDGWPPHISSSEKDLTRKESVRYALLLNKSLIFPGFPFRASPNDIFTNPNNIKDAHILHINHAWLMKEYCNT